MTSRIHCSVWQKLLKSPMIMIGVEIKNRSCEFDIHAWNTAEINCLKCTLSWNDKPKKSMSFIVMMSSHTFQAFIALSH